MRILQITAHEISQTHQAAEISLINGAWTALTKNLSVETLMKTYQDDVERKKILLRKAGVTRSEMLFLTQSLKTLLSDENFVTLLRAEGLANLPKTVADRVSRIEGEPV
ncbi:hypothetical protein LOE28_07705 [Pseudosulfitobacter pseudonitzschiae]|uniref:hypothetical protein n=1 Tax=Pseudosulfitobacter pseudonitzschiae TaxID=1402135 RepID=UPI001E38386D|nr:hypothetical protein [Pseudosulfitobacter pseudonitzschiae]UFE62854.1 hypothetical protein LOE28_07705 [Pseudosulfitobacter pseudonitzschiae]